MSTTLAAVLDLTEQVQAAIDAGDWERARDLDIARLGQLEQLATEVKADDQGGARRALGALEERNRRMIGEVHHHRRRVLRDASLVKTGQTAAAAYGEFRPET
jgi:hypothetical protein